MKTPEIPIDIFVCYAHADERWVTEGSPCGLLPWLSNQLKNNAVRFWWDHGIHAGDDFERTINEKIDAVQIVILLISDDFAGSDYIIDKELPRIRNRYDAGEILVIPILVSTVSRLNRDRLTWVVGIQMLPNDQKGLNVMVNSGSWEETRAQILDEIYHRICVLRSSLRDTIRKDPERQAGEEPKPLAARDWDQTQHERPSANPAKPGKAIWMAFVTGIVLLGIVSWVVMKLKNDPGKASEQTKPIEDSKDAEPPANKTKMETDLQSGPQHPQEAVEDGAEKAIQATREEPFVNSLGMKFVPVKITGGPSGGQAVLFCIWETRVQDYRQYAATTNGVDEAWKSPGVKQGENHPVTFVSWDDSVRFCRWLEEREKRERIIPAAAKYRLPTDHEWSCAVGIGERERAADTPKAKDAKITDAFPWGTQWPPPNGIGNYGSILKVDSWNNTSPVGGFPASDNGLHDLGGNVWEWCEDDAKEGESWKVSRGASWLSNGKDKLSSSGRLANYSDRRAEDSGFRCVLELGQPKPRIQAEPNEPASPDSPAPTVPKRQ